MSCILCDGSGEIINRPTRLMGATYPEDDQWKGDEHFEPCPLCGGHPRVLKGRRIVCGETGGIHYEQEEIATFQFVDYGWWCNCCGKYHCSMCGYESDGETITVWDCGRFG